MLFQHLQIDIFWQRWNSKAFRANNICLPHPLPSKSQFVCSSVWERSLKYNDLEVKIPKLGKLSRKSSIHLDRKAIYPRITHRPTRTFLWKIANPKSDANQNSAFHSTCRCKHRELIYIKMTHFLWLYPTLPLKLVDRCLISRAARNWKHEL